MKLIAPHLLNEQQIEGQLYKYFLLMELDLGEAETMEINGALFK